jgi:hypothetical protein
MPEKMEVISCHIYEDWHMFISSPEKKNYWRIAKYLSHRDGHHMNGGFVPILIRVDTLRLIIDDIIKYSLDFIAETDSEQFRWWGAIAGFNIACHNHKIRMISADNCYFPNINQIDNNKHYWAHYSCDPIFEKHAFPNINIKDFPNNAFYNFIKEWMVR